MSPQDGVLGAGIPLVGTEVKRIIIELRPTNMLNHFQVRTLKEGLDDKGWDFVHGMMAQALHQVAEAWVGSIQPVMMMPPMEVR